MKSLNTHMNANIHLAMNSFGTLFQDKIFSLTFPWLLTTSLTFPWHVPNSLTFPGFPDKWSPCKQQALPLRYCVRVTSCRTGLRWTWPTRPTVTKPSTWPKAKLSSSTDYKAKYNRLTIIISHTSTFNVSHVPTRKEILILVHGSNFA